MLNETHIKFTSPTFMVSHPNPAVLKPWHGTSDIFTQSSVNYNSFSLEKAQRQTIKNRILQTQGISKRKDLVTQIKIRKAVQTTIKNEDEWGAILKEKIKGHKEHDELYQKSATLIQKYARRFLTKLKYEPLLISKRKRDVSVDIDLMKTQADGCLFHLGKITNEAAVVLQRAWKRYLVRKKLLAMRACFDLYCQDKQEQSTRFVKRALRIMVARMKVRYLKFLEYRKTRLVIIREKVAILSIKKSWKHKKLTLKIMKDRFHRLKQKKIAMQNKEMYQKFLQSLNKDRPRESATPHKTPTNMRDEYFDEDENEVKELLVEESSEDVFREARKIQALIEKKIKDRIIKGKLAYSVMPFKAVSIMPKATENQIRESYEIYHQTTFKNSTVATQAKSVVVTRENLPKARLTVISSPPKMGHRRVGSDVLPPLIQPPINDIPYRAESISLPKEIENASFMASTISFMSKLGTNESYRSSRRRNPIKKLGDKHFLNNTMTQSLKKEAKRSASVEPQWAPVGGAKEKYTLGIYNNNFKEKSWTPNPFNVLKDTKDKPLFFKFSATTKNKEANHKDDAYSATKQSRGRQSYTPSTYYTHTSSPFEAL